MQLFSPETKSPWSRLNKQRVEKLIEQGIDDTRRARKIANRNKTALELARRKNQPPVSKSSTQNDTARQYFMAFSPSSKKVSFGGSALSVLKRERRGFKKP